MMWQSFRPLLWIIALVGAVLLVLAGFVAQDWTEHIVPSPENTAEQLVTALGAHRYEGAMNQLSSDLQQQLTQEDLRELVRSIEGSPAKGIEDAHGQNAEAQNGDASAQVQVKLTNQQQVTLSLPLRKENGLWKVVSLDPIRSLSIR